MHNIRVYGIYICMPYPMFLSQQPEYLIFGNLYTHIVIISQYFNLIFFAARFQNQIISMRALEYDYTACVYIYALFNNDNYCALQFYDLSLAFGGLTKA